MLYTYSFSGRTRDLTDIFSTVVKDEPRFISNFRSVISYGNENHDWIEDKLESKAVNVSSARNGMLFCDDNELQKMQVGTLLVLDNDSALFIVTKIEESYAVVELAAKNGSNTTADTLPQNGCVFFIVSKVDDKTTKNIQANFNGIQTFKKDITLSGSALKVSLWGNADNQVNRQTAIALSDLTRDLNRVAIFGRRIERNKQHDGECGGLYAFATGAGALEIDAKQEVITHEIIDSAAHKIIAEGGDPGQILCSPGQARLISKRYSDRFQILRSDDRRGSYIAAIINEINGRGFTVIADPDIPDSDCWVLDATCFGLACKKVSDNDTTPKGFDGIHRTVTAELSLEFKNAKQRCCRIKNLQFGVIAALEENK
jgi:hypothetical protein